MKEFLRSLVRPLKPVWRAWQRIAHIIGRVNTTILLSIFYFVILGIAKFVTVLGRKDLLDERWKDRTSYWRKRERLQVRGEDFLKPY